MLVIFEALAWSLFYVLIAAGRANRIAIIGSGIGGTATAYFLREIQDNHRTGTLEIDLFEELNTVGGRLVLTEINGEWYEGGGSVIHPKNAYMNGFLEKFRLKRREINTHGLFGIYDGNDLVFEESDYSIVTILKLLYKYGTSPFSLDKSVSHYIDKFKKIYEIQRSGMSFRTVAELLSAIDSEFFNQTLVSAEDLLKTAGFGERFVRQMVEPIIRVNYGQHLGVHGFVGLIALGGAQSHLWSVSGGNKLIAENLLNESRANIKFDCTVDNVSKLGENNFTIHCSDSDTFYYYDYVVCASPLIKSENNENIKFIGFEKPLADYGFVKYHKLFVTFVEGRLRPRFERLSAILACCEYENLNSIGVSRPVSLGTDTYSTYNSRVEGQSIIFKVFSSANLTRSDQTGTLSHFFENDFRIARVIEWRGAYPQFEGEFDLVAKSAFEIYDDVFYVNAIEMAASAMEMSVIGAKNVALLIGDRLLAKSQTESTYAKSLREKSEL